MTHRINSPCSANRQAGFTLVEMLVVMSVIALMFGFVLMSGPARSHRQEMQAAVDKVAQTLRIARSNAIASNNPVQFLMDTKLGTFRIDQGIRTVLPRFLVVATTSVIDDGLGENIATIRFEGDGSASGGRIELIDGEWRAQVGVDWMTGRITVSRPR